MTYIPTALVVRSILAWFKAQPRTNWELGWSGWVLQGKALLLSFLARVHVKFIEMKSCYFALLKYKKTPALVVNIGAFRSLRVGIVR